METLEQANVFFIISSIGFVILGILLVIVLGYLIKVMRTIRDISVKMLHLSDRAKVEGEYFFSGLHEASDRLRNRRFSLLALVWLIRKLIKRYT